MKNYYNDEYKDFIDSVNMDRIHLTSDSDLVKVSDKFYKLETAPDCSLKEYKAKFLEVTKDMHPSGMGLAVIKEYVEKRYVEYCVWKDNNYKNGVVS